MFGPDLASTRHKGLQLAFARHFLSSSFYAAKAPAEGVRDSSVMGRHADRGDIYAIARTVAAECCRRMFVTICLSKDVSRLFDQSNNGANAILKFAQPYRFA